MRVVTAQDLAPIAEGNAALEAGDFDRAIEKFDALIGIVPLPQFYVQRGRAWLGRQDAARALADLDDALRLNVMGAQGGDDATALSLSTEMLATAQVARGQCLSMLGRWSDAAAAFDQALESLPDSVRVRQLRDEARAKRASSGAGTAAER